PATPLVTALERLRAASPANAPFRIAGIGPALYPNTNVMFGFEDTRVHDPMANGRYLGFLRELTSYDPADYYAKWNDPDSPLLDLLNVAWLVTDQGVDLQNRARYELVYDGFDGRIYRNRRAMPRFFSVPNVVVEPTLGRYVAALKGVTNWRDTAVTQSDAPRGAAIVAIESADGDRYQLRVNSAQPALVVSSIALYPGWRIRSGGRSLEPVAVNGPFLGFVVPPGQRIVTIRYAPASFRVGVVAFVLGALVLVFVRRLMW
ncbi:MAG: YfhO family protein, partial [Thermoanaerobaculia bacterium]